MGETYSGQFAQCDRAGFENSNSRFTVLWDYFRESTDLSIHKKRVMYVRFVSEGQMNT